MTYCGPRTGHSMYHGGGCCCCGCGGGGYYHRRYLSKEERRKLLEEYRDNLAAELAEVEKRLQSSDEED